MQSAEFILLTVSLLGQVHCCGLLLFLPSLIFCCFSFLPSAFLLLTLGFVVVVLSLIASGARLGGLFEMFLVS